MLLCGALLILGCTEKKEESAKPPEPVKPKVERVQAKVPTNLPLLDAPKAAVIEAPRGRILHPIGGPTCQEMYTACTKVPGKPDLCTSASFGIQCGETQRLPATGELLSCVCP